MLRPTLFSAAFGGFFSLMLLSCGDDNTSTPNTQTEVDMAVTGGGMDMGVDTPGDELATRVDLLDSIAVNVYSPTYVEFRESLRTLDAAVSEWAQSQTDEARTAAQAAWRTSMTIWQRAELMQVGPAGAQGRRVGGEDGRDRIYSFPLSNACRVDQELVAQRYDGETWTTTAQLNVRGMDALEYLLFHTGDENTCPDVVGINRNGEWTAMIASGAGEVDKRRAAMAQVTVSMVAADAQVLVDAWAEDGVYRTALSAGSVPFENTKQALDQVYAGMFYLDRMVKDLKLAKPAGLSMECESDTCPNAVESRFANASKEHLVANLVGLRHVFEGGDDDSYIGFDDILEVEGAAELAATMRMKFEASIAAVEAIEGTLQNAVIENHSQVQNAYDAVKALNDDLKTQFVTTLGLSVPQEGAGDND